MEQYPFFLAQFITFGYLVIYFLILYIRYRSKIVTDEMIALPKWRFMVIDVLEALGVANRMASAAMLLGPTIPILNQVAPPPQHPSQKKATLDAEEGLMSRPLKINGMVMSAFTDALICHYRLDWFAREVS